jgi:hypothetical protein
LTDRLKAVKKMNSKQTAFDSLAKPSLRGHLFHLRCFQLGSGIEGFFITQMDEENPNYCYSCHKIQASNICMVTQSKPLRKIQKRTGVLFKRVCRDCNNMLKPMRINKDDDHIPLVWLRTTFKDAQAGNFSHEFYKQIEMARITKADIERIVRSLHKRLEVAVKNMNYATETISTLDSLYANHLWETYDERRKRANYAISKQEIRQMVFGRDGFKCRNCNSRKHLSVDHITPVVLGGSDDLNNLQTLCKSCNSKKGSTTENQTY